MNIDDIKNNIQGKQNGLLIQKQNKEKRLQEINEETIQKYIEN